MQFLRATWASNLYSLPEFPDSCAGLDVSQLFKADLLTFWFSLFGLFLVEVPKD